MCTPHSQATAGLRQAGGSFASSRTSAQEAQFIAAFDRIVATLGSHPIDDGIFWDSIDSTEYFVDHTDIFNEALRNRSFRTFAARYTQSQVNNNIWNAITRRYTRMSAEHRGIINVFLQGKVESSLIYQLAWDTHSQTLAMMRRASSALSTLAGNPTELSALQQRLNRMLTSSDRSVQDAGRQIMQGIGINSVADLSNSDTMAASIRATVRLIDAMVAEIRVIAPQNLFKTIVQFSGAQQNLIRALGASQRSFIAHCAQIGIERGDAQLSREAWARSLTAITSGLVIAIATSGAGVPAAVGLIAGAATSAATGLPGLVSAYEAVDAARVGEASGTMDEHAIEDAESGRNISTGLYILGILIPNGAGTFFGATRGAVTGVVSGTGLSVLFEALGGLSSIDRSSAGFDILWEKLNAMTPEQRDAMSVVFNDVLDSENIPDTAKPAVMAAFAQAHPESLEKTANEAGLDLVDYCRGLTRR